MLEDRGMKIDLEGPTKTQKVDEILKNSEQCNIEEDEGMCVENDSSDRPTAYQYENQFLRMKMLVSEGKMSVRME